MTTWTTAQMLVAPANTPRPARTKGPEASNLPVHFADQTVRTVSRVSVGGRRIRVELSNMIGAQLMQIGAASVAIHRARGEIVDGTDRALRSSCPSSSVR